MKKFRRSLKSFLIAVMKARRDRVTEMLNRNNQM
jgi:hypothetical protein